MADMVKFKRGTLAKLGNVGKVAGQILVCTDERAMYLDLSSTERIRIGDFQEYANWAAIQAIPTTNLSTTALYYATAENILAKYTGSGWNQINAQNDLAALGGVSQSVYDAKIKDLEDADQANADNISGVDERLKAAEEILKDVATGSGVAELTERVTAVEGKVATIEGDYLKSSDKTTLEGKIAEAQSAGDNAQLYAEGVAKDLGDHEKDGVAHITAAEREAWNGKATMAQVEAKGYLVAADIAGKADSTQVATDIAAAVKTETDNRVAADEAIEAKIGTVAEGKTVVQMISEAQAAATYDDEEVRGLISDNAGAIDDIEKDYLKAADKTELQGNIDTVSGKVNTLVGEDANKSVRTIANEELAKQLIAEGAAESLDTLQEIAAWIQSHPDDASAMNDAIVALQKQLQGIDAGESTVKKYVDDAIAALNVGQYALAADLTALAGRVSALETASATHALKTEVEAVSDALDEYKTAHAGDYTNAQIDAAIDADVKVVADALDEYKTAHKDDYTNKQIDDAIANAGHASASDLANHIADTVSHVTAEDKVKWNAAEQNAKDYADGLNTAMDTRVKVLEAIDHDKILSDAKSYADGLAGNYDANGSAAQALVDAKAYADTAESDAVTTANAYTDSALTWSEF